MRSPEADDAAHSARLSEGASDPLPATSPRHLRLWRYRIFAVSWLTYAAYYLGRVNLGVAAPALERELGWERAAIGLLGSAFYWVYAVSQLVNGHLGDRLSARVFVALGLAVSGLLNLLFGSLEFFGLMLVVWALNGWAQATGWGPIMKTLSRWFATEERGNLTALFSPCYVVGHALSWALAGWLIASKGWRHAYWVPGMILLGMSAFWYASIRDQPETIGHGATRARQVSLKAFQTRSNLLSGVRDMISQHKLGWALVVCFLSGMIKDGLTLWGPTYLVEQQGLEIASAALSGTLIPIAGALGAVLAGWSMHRARKRREAPVVVSMAGVVALALLGLQVPAAVGQWWSALGLLAVMALGSHGINALLMASLPLSLGPNGNVSSVAGTLDFASYVGGGLSALLLGWLQDFRGWGAVFSWWLAIAVGIAFVAAGQLRARAPARRTH